MYESVPFHSLNPEDIFQTGTIALPKATGLLSMVSVDLNRIREGRRLVI